MKYIILLGCFLVIGASYAQTFYAPGGVPANSNSGFAGVGSGVPTARFHIQQPAGSWTDGLRLSLMSKNWDFVLDTSGDRLIVAQDQNTYKGFVVYNGNFGVGINNPAAKFQVYHNATSAYANAAHINSINPNIHWPFMITTNDKSNHSGFVNSPTSDIYMLLRDQNGNVGVQLHSLGHSFFKGGNVGVGNSNPQKKLEVNSGVNDFVSFGNVLSIGQYTGIHFGYLENTTGALYRKSALVFERVDAAARGKIHFLNNNTNNSTSTTLADSRMTIDVDGDVGIGNTAPLGPLHVNTIRPVIIKGNGGNGVYGSEIGFNATLNTAIVPNEFKKLGGTSQKGAAAMVVDYHGNMAIQTYAGVDETESVIPYKPQYIFTNTGKFGVGTNAPLTSLHITAPGSGATASGTNPTTGVLIGCDDSGTALNMGVYATGPQYSWIQSRSKSSSLMMDLALNPLGGRVAIGTHDPAVGYQLSVAGKAIATEVVVMLQTSWPDYVFEKEHNKPTLPELETYINENKHLPEVPTANDVKENGVALGEMNALLLKKVEELTLYLIEQNKQMQKQNQLTEEQAEQIKSLQIRLQALESK